MSRGKLKQTYLSTLHSLGAVNGAVRTLLAFIFLANTADALYMPIFAVYISHYVLGASLETAGFYIAIFSIMKSIVQVPLARRLDSVRGEKDDFWVLVVGAFFATIYPFMLVFITNAQQLYAAAILAGFSSACIMSAYYSLFSHHTDKRSEAFEWSLFSVWGLTVSQAIGAALGGIAAQMWGFRTLFVISGSLNFFTLIVITFLLPHLNFKFKRKQKLQANYK